MKINLQKWGAVWCQPCIDLSKRKTLEKFQAAHPEVKVSIHDDTEKGSVKWDKRAEELGVKNLPTLVWMYGDQVLLKSEDVRGQAIEEQYMKAYKKALKLSGGA